MELSSVFELRDKALMEHYSDELRIDASIRATSADVPRRPEHRIAIGARFRAPRDYQMAIRVQRRTGRAMRHARRLIDGLPNKDEADLAVLEKVTAPSRYALATAASEDGKAPGAKRRRPAEIGFSIGHLDGAPGTLGMFGDHEEHGVVALSNNHVIALSNAAAKNDEIYQAGIPHSHPDIENLLGRLGGYRKIRKVGSNGFDAAYCILDDQDAHNGNVIPKDFRALDAGKPLGAPIDTDEFNDLLAKIGKDATVAKNGLKTGYTSVSVTNVTIGLNDVIVDIPGLRNCRFDDLIEIEFEQKDRPFTDFGDSGAVAYLEKERAPFGMLFAAGVSTRTGRKRYVSYACSLPGIFQAYDLALLE